MYDTRRKAVLEILVKRSSLGATGMDFINLGGGLDYRRRIHELRKDGYPIKDSWVSVNRRTRVKRYFLETK